MAHKDSVLVDTNVTIESHRVGPFTIGYSIETVED